ncbi:MAG: Mur ligase family protein [Patescibacteria group bacterium]|nr:Mur ligase family protein [Patescibacteria group bacterium]
MLNSEVYEEYLREVELLKSLLYREKWRPASRRDKKLVLKRMSVLLKALGNPERRINFVLVGGTSGKGSVATMIYQALLQNGVRCGLHSKPFLTSPTEETSVNGKLISSEEFIFCSRRVRAALLQVYRGKFGMPTYLEAMTALTLVAFKNSGIKWAVVEVGLGGRFDRTNVLPARLSVITNVSRDHLESIGPTLKNVAWHKAGLIRKGQAAAVIGRMPLKIEKIFLAEARKKRVPIFIAQDQPSESFYDSNRNLALLAVQTLRESVLTNLDLKAAKKGINAVRLAGRMEEIKSRPPTILDAAHNPAKMEHIVRSLRSRGIKKVNLVFGALSGKDYKEMVKIVSPLTAKAYLSQPLVEKRDAVRPANLAKEFKKYGIRTRETFDPLEAYALAKRNRLPVLITGSLYLVGNVREIWWPEAKILEEKRNI